MRQGRALAYEVGARAAREAARMAARYAGRQAGSYLSEKMTKRSKPKTKTVASGGKISARGGMIKTKSKKVKKAPRKTLSRRLDRVEKELKSDMSYKYVKNVQTVSQSCNLGSMSAVEIEGINSGTVRNAIAALDIGTGTAINGQTVGENTQISIKDCWSELVVANTTDSACYVNIYAIKVKQNSAVGPYSAFVQANDDSGIGAVASGQFQVTSYPTLFPDFKKHCAVVDSVRCYLRAGDQAKLSFTIPDFKWSDDYYDDHTVTYLRGKNMMFLVRLEGDICFDSNSLTRGSTIASSIMCKSRTNFTVEYAGNVASRVWTTGNSMDTAAFIGVGTQVGPNVIDIQS